MIYVIIKLTFEQLPLYKVVVLFYQTNGAQGSNKVRVIMTNTNLA